MENKKDIVKQTLEEFNVFKNMIAESRQQVYNSVAKQQIKEALNEADFDEEDVDDELANDIEDSTSNDETQNIESGESDDTETDLENTEEINIEDTEDLTDNDEGDSIELDTEEDYDVVDMTQASDDQVIQVFKKMSDSDEIEIVDDEVTISDPDSGNEYKIVLPDTTEDVADVDTDLDLDDSQDLDLDSFEDDGEADLDLDTEDSTEDLDAEENDSTDELDLDTEDSIEGEEDEDDEDIVFEVELNETKEAISEEEDLDDNMLDESEETLEEQIPVGNAQARRVPATNAINAKIVGAGAREVAKLKETIAKLELEKTNLTENVKILAEDNNKQIKVLELFKEKINETKVYTKNLAAITKLFLEYSTTQQEKKDIVESLSNAKTLAESEIIEKRLISELSKKGSITESIEKTINLNVASSVSKSVINETAYIDPALERMKKMMYDNN